MNNKIDKFSLFKSYYHKIILYEFIQKKKQSNDSNDYYFGKVKKKDYINSIYFVGLFYLQNLNDYIDFQLNEEMKIKFFEKYSEYFLNPVQNEIIEKIKSIIN